MRRHGPPGSRRIFRKYRRSQSGVTAIEFAMVAPPFFALMMAIFEVGIMLFSEYVIEHGVGKASRMIRTGEVQAVPMTATQFRTLVCGNLASYLDCETDLHIDVRAFNDFGSVVLPAPLTAEGELSADVTTLSQFNPGDPIQVVVVRVYYAWSLFAPGMTYMANMSEGRRLLAAGAAFRNEPYAK
ncbi:MAG TPA: TadE/TadG family type IV pilus assembly protein [Aestuariivirgaceae bacterium]|nr:TadE/TadG family type IV pilus assembly protein [Aestuariivirgaceae bacterium]